MPLAPSFKWNVNQPSIDRLVKAYTRQNLNNISEVIANVARQTANDIKSNYILRGSWTGTPWHAMINQLRGNQPGARVETGRMLRSVGSKMTTEDDGAQIDGQYGLRMPGAGGRKYYLDQEYGTNIKSRMGMRTFERSLPSMKSNLRKQMLMAGFLYGKTDARGTAVLNQMKAGLSFADAWAGATRRSPAQMEAWREHQLRSQAIYESQQIATQRQLEAHRMRIIRAYGSLENWGKAKGYK